jgi:hypothetical protein
MKQNKITQGWAQISGHRTPLVVPWVNVHTLGMFCTLQTLERTPLYSEPTKDEEPNIGDTHRWGFKCMKDALG